MTLRNTYSKETSQDERNTKEFSYIREKRRLLHGFFVFQISCGKTLLNLSKDLSSLMSTDNLHQRLFSETTMFHNISIEHPEDQSESENERLKRGMNECIYMLRKPAKILSDLVHFDGDGIFQPP